MKLSRRKPPVEHLRLDVSVPPERCCICKLAIDADLLTLTLADQDGVYEVSVCRFCLLENAPSALAEIEAAASIDGASG